MGNQPQSLLEGVQHFAGISPNHHACRICHERLPAPFLDFGAMPLANAFLTSLEEAREETRYPLAVTVCNACGLVQLTHVVPAKQLYRRYIYVSSTSEAVKAHAASLAHRLVQHYAWDQSDMVVEVASNDGTVLKAFQRQGVEVLGVEPAENIAALAQADGIPTLPEFFTAATARQIRHRHGRISGILGRHVFAHVDDLHDFLDGVDALLADDGVFLVEVPYLGDLIRHMEFDTIYHEHLSYFALEPVARLCHDHGFRLVDVDRVALHGGSMILHIRRHANDTPVSERLERLLEEEHRWSLGSLKTLHEFAEAVKVWRERFLACIGELERNGASFVGYGAAAKANTLLNYCPAAAKLLNGILDRSVHKHGRYTPGTHVLVKPAEQWTETGATHILILAWNFKEEIMEQLRPFAERGGRFIIPIPQPEVI